MPVLAAREFIGPQVTAMGSLWVSPSADKPPAEQPMRSAVNAASRGMAALPRRTRFARLRVPERS